MLTGEPPLVAAAAALLEAVLAGNEGAMARLYLTGAFFFALAYVRVPHSYSRRCPARRVPLLFRQVVGCWRPARYGAAPDVQR